MKGKQWKSPSTGSPINIAKYPGACNWTWDLSESRIEEKYRRGSGRDRHATGELEILCNRGGSPASWPMQQVSRGAARASSVPRKTSLFPTIARFLRGNVSYSPRLQRRVPRRTCSLTNPHPTTVEHCSTLRSPSSMCDKQADSDLSPLSASYRLLFQQI